MYKQIWKVEYNYDNGEDDYRTHYAYHNIMYLNGTTDQIRDWVKNIISYGNTQIVDLSTKTRYKIKTEYTEIPEHDNVRIVGKQKRWEEDGWACETTTYTATPTTLDKIIINL